MRADESDKEEEEEDEEETKEIDTPHEVEGTKVEEDASCRSVWNYIHNVDTLSTIMSTCITPLLVRCERVYCQGDESSRGGDGHDTSDGMSGTMDRCGHMCDKLVDLSDAG